MIGEAATSDNYSFGKGPGTIDLDLSTNNDFYQYKDRVMDTASFPCDAVIRC